MSVSGKMAMAVLRAAARLRKTERYDIDKELQKAREYNRKHPYRLPQDRRALYRELTIAGYPCLIIRAKKAPVREGRAILFLHGGIKNDWKPELSIARGYAAHTGIEVWYPIYPPVTEGPITQAIDVILQTYRQMAGKYGPEKSAILGDSFGGTFAFTVVDQLNRNGHPEQMPGLVIANSPGGLPDREEDWALMYQYAARDPIISVPLMKMAEEIIKRQTPSLPGHALYPRQMDFHHAPETWVYYAEETCAGVSAAYAGAYRRDGSAHRMHMRVEPDVMHCYACCPVFPESKRDFQEQIALLKTL